MTTVSAALLPSLASAAPWEINTVLEDSNYTSQKVELVDLNGDGYVDLVFANTKGDNTGSQAGAQLNQVFMNNAGASFDADASVFTTPDTAYVIKAGDVDNDGDPDLVVGVNFAGKSYVLLNDNGTFSESMLGDGLNLSIGDLELGDVDNDGNLDIVAADWGMSQPYGDPDDSGGPIRMWLGDGKGGFTVADAQLPMGMAALASWAFDIELVDLDNDYALDLFISTRGFGKALVFKNDGGGNFSNYPVPALQPAMGKNVNVAFTPMDFDGDDFVDVLTLQDGVGAGACIDIDGIQYCAKRNSLLINDMAGQFKDNPGTYWPQGINPPKLDFDAATLDFDNNGTPDFVVSGLRLAGNDNNNRLILNDQGGKVFKAPMAPNDVALPIDPGLGSSFGIAFADFNQDKREDVAVAVRDPDSPNVVLFGAEGDTGVPVDTSAPNIGVHEMLADLLYFGQSVTFRGRAHDYKTPTQWHDFLYDPDLESLNLIGANTETAHGRRLPYMEFMFGLANKDDIKTTPDTDNAKYIVPATWAGEALWKIEFEVPLSKDIPDTLTWQFCAIDAAGNKACDGPYQVMVDINCGNGVVDLGEDCDDDSELCVNCKNTCGDGVCENPPENSDNCPEDCPICDNDGVCEPPENNQNCPNDCPDVLCGNGVCDPGETNATCPEDCPDDSGDDEGMCNNDNVCDEAEKDDPACDDCCDHDGMCEEPQENKMWCDDCDDDTPTDSFTTMAAEESSDTLTATESASQLDDDGCGCDVDESSTQGILASLALLGLFGLPGIGRRRRQS